MEDKIPICEGFFITERNYATRNGITMPGGVIFAKRRNPRQI